MVTFSLPYNNVKEAQCFVGGVWRGGDRRYPRLWLTICCLLWWSKDFDNLAVFIFSPSLGGAHSIEFWPSSWCYLSPRPVRSSLFQPLQCGEAMIRLSDISRACCCQISHPCSPLLWLLTSGLAAGCLLLRKAFCMCSHIWTCGVAIRPHLQSLVIFCRQNWTSSSVIAFVAFL